MLQRINGILGASQNTKKQGDSQSQDGQALPKEGEKVERDTKKEQNLIRKAPSLYKMTLFL